MDLWVTNFSLEANCLMVNDGNGYFEENAIFNGIGYNGNGLPEAGMGVDIGDVNGDGWLDIFVTNFSGDTQQNYSLNLSLSEPKTYSQEC